MEKERLGVIFGGMSTENEVSVVSANSVIKNLDREKYEIDRVSDIRQSPALKAEDAVTRYTIWIGGLPS